jgi:hypothetical protein
MSHKFIVLTAAAIALGSVAIASTIARSGVAQPYQSKADFDQAFAAVGASMPAQAAADMEKLRQAGLKRIDLAQSAR